MSSRFTRCLQTASRRLAQVLYKGCMISLTKRGIYSPCSRLLGRRFKPMRYRTILICPALLLVAGLVLGKDPQDDSAELRGHRIDCLSTPSDQLGHVSLILIA